MKQFAWVIVTLVLAGCQRQAGPADGGSLRYQGRTADAWGKEVFDKDQATAQTAAYALSQLGEEGLPYIVRAVASNDRATSHEALKVLTHQAAQLKPYSSTLVPALIRKLELEPWVESGGPSDWTESDVWRAAQVLGKMGRDARPALPALRKAQRSKQPTIRQHVGEALKTIEASAG